MNPAALVSLGNDAGRALGIHISALVNSMVEQRLAVLGVVESSVHVVVKEAAENPLKVVFGGQELLFPLGEVVTVPAGVLSSLESMGQPVYRDLGLGVTEITAGVVFEVV